LLIESIPIEPPWLPSSCQKLSCFLQDLVRLGVESVYNCSLGAFDLRIKQARLAAGAQAAACFPIGPGVTSFFPAPFSELFLWLGGLEVGAFRAPEKLCERVLHASKKRFLRFVGATGSDALWCSCNDVATSGCYKGQRGSCGNMGLAGSHVAEVQKVLPAQDCGERFCRRDTSSTLRFVVSTSTPCVRGVRCER
jgi:hypothetical protein